MNAEKQRLDLFAGALRLAYVKLGAGRTFLLLHGGAGFGSMLDLASAIARENTALLPIHPGHDGEPRPAWLTRISDLALAYLSLLEKLDSKDVVVVGNSIGGWIAAEIALRKSPRVAGVVLLNAVGIATDSPDDEIANPGKIPPPELIARAFHDPANAAKLGDPTTLAANARTTHVYAGDPYMHDPGLRERLANVTTPTLVAWGESDRLIGLPYARRYQSSIPGATLETIPMAGHCPQIEQVENTRRVLEQFAARGAHVREVR